MSFAVGLTAETSARDFLVKKGLKWIESNYRCKLGEIDLIMRDKDTLVFVEVKFRSSGAYGGALESITVSKQRKILKTASLYLLMRRIHDRYPVRFDVVCLEGTPPVINWISNAFTG